MTEATTQVKTVAPSPNFAGKAHCQLIVVPMDSNGLYHFVESRKQVFAKQHMVL